MPTLVLVQSCSRSQFKLWFPLCFPPRFQGGNRLHWGSGEAVKLFPPVLPGTLHICLPLYLAARSIEPWVISGRLQVGCWQSSQSSGCWWCVLALLFPLTIFLLRSDRPIANSAPKTKQISDRGGGGWGPAPSSGPAVLLNELYSSLQTDLGKWKRLLTSAGRRPQEFWPVLILIYRRSTLMVGRWRGVALPLMWFSF